MENQLSRKKSVAGGDALKENERKWSKPLMDAGYTVIPSVIIERQQALGLDPLDINILLHLLRHWWKADNLPYPGKKLIAKCIGVDESTVRRRIAAMEKEGLIERVERIGTHGGKLTNEYRFDGMIKEATPFAKEALQDRKKRQQEDVDRVTRKKPRLPTSGDKQTTRVKDERK